MPEIIDINLIRTDGGTQQRVTISDEAVADYAEIIKSLPPVSVFSDGRAFWLVDGFHRLAAAKKAGLGQIEANVQIGTRRDAVLKSVGANAAHGLRRSNEDKRRAVVTLLSDAEWSKWSDRIVATHCAVSHTFVAQIRAKLAPKQPPASGNVATPAPERGNVATPTAPVRAPERTRPAPVSSDATPRVTAADVQPIADAVHASFVADLQEPFATAALPPAAMDFVKKLGAVVKSVQAVRMEMKTLLEQPEGANINPQRVDADLKNVIEAIKFGRPHAPCPVPHGQGKCQLCKGLGWVTKPVWDGIDPAIRGGAA